MTLIHVHKPLEGREWESYCGIPRPNEYKPGTRPHHTIGSTYLDKGTYYSDPPSILLDLDYVEICSDCSSEIDIARRAPGEGAEYVVHQSNEDSNSHTLCGIPHTDLPGQHMTEREHGRDWDDAPEYMSYVECNACKAAEFHEICTWKP